MENTKVITPVKCDNPGCACTNCRCCVRKKLESTEMGATSDGLSSLMWNADGREMEIEVVECAKVRCDEDDVNGVALGIADEEAELERWLGELMLDDAEDKDVNGGLSCIEMDSRVRDNSADQNGSMDREFVDASLFTPPAIGVGLVVDKGVDASMFTPLVIDIGPTVGEDVEAPMSTPPAIDIQRTAWVEYYCGPVKPVLLEDFGVDWQSVTKEEVVEMAHEAERLKADDVPVTPLTLTREDMLKFYAYNRCLCAKGCALGDSVCGFCASRVRKRVREELKEKKDELKAAWKEAKRVKEMDKVRKTLFVGVGGEYGGGDVEWPESNE